MLYKYDTILNIPKRFYSHDTQPNLIFGTKAIVFNIWVSYNKFINREPYEYFLKGAVLYF